MDVTDLVCENVK